MFRQKHDASNHAIYKEGDKNKKRMCKMGLQLTQVESLMHQNYEYLNIPPNDVDQMDTISFHSICFQMRQRLSMYLIWFHQSTIQKIML